ncbi:MAG: bifunctional hydroxymethylpyrimidine kinase/phosphomethylpyrimidine kinase [Desulfobacteraceae bacterium]|nr:bifunctional hydroxymethylpyrimidine kinase/phosphomethylpyrimidine kinase [Desulfobacteraceae bacterium]
MNNLKHTPPIALTIAGSDSSGGAGIQADIKTFQALGVYAMSAVTAVTVQNTQKVYAVQEIDAQIVHDQIACLFEDSVIHAVKIGMVSSKTIAEAICEALKKAEPANVVLDPVMVSKSGYRLLKPEARQALVDLLFPLASVVTPNIYEVEVLQEQKIITVEDMKDAARRIHDMGVANVVVKGGHLGGSQAIDVVYDGETFEELNYPRISTLNTHGTGCTFSSAITAFLAKDFSFPQAVKQAKQYISGAISNSLNIGKGQGPTNHYYIYRGRVCS